ncbi:MAG TPA: pyruvate formate lyase-activating protein [Firmicutes bacterium]|nr:pyruvate formate lyase-activating protein [Bacillota bacterium]
MEQCNIKGSVDSIETFGLVDGPGIRTVIFLNGCSLRCKYCHNPEMWDLKDKNYSVSDVVSRILRSKPYFKNGGGATFSGGEPLMQSEFLLECAKKLKENGIHVAIDTAGICKNFNSEIFKYIDLVLLDIKHITKDGFNDVTSRDYFDMYMKFLEELNKSNIEVWIRQVIVPGIHDNVTYMKDLVKFIKNNIKNVKRVDFLPYHKLGSEKYEALGLTYPYKDKEEMNKDKCDELYKIFMEDFNN